MKQKLNIMALMAIVMTMLFSQTAKAADVMYTIFNSATSTMTFYYGEKPAAGTNETVYDVTTNNTSTPKWYSISGQIETVVFDSSFNNADPKSCFYWFNNCSNLTTITGIDNLHTDNVTNMNGMFYGCKSLESLTLPESFNTANVENMNHMFRGCSSLTSLTLPENFNTANVTNMSYMFNGCSNLESLTLSENFKAAKVTDMQNMFKDCSKLTSLDLSNFNTANVTTMYNMFNGCSNLKTIYVSDKFTTKSVKSSTYMFSNCTALVGAVKFISGNVNMTYANYNTGYFKTYCKVGDTQYDMCGEELKVVDLALIDGKDFVAHAPFTATNVSYARTISPTAPKWGSLCLPFEYTPSDFEAYQLTSSDDVNNTITLEKIEGPIDAGTPVLFKNPTERTSLNISAENANIVTLPVEGTATEPGNLKLVGTYQAKTFSTDDKNCFILKDDKLMNTEKLLSNGKVTKVGLNAYRAYMVNETPSPAPQTYSIETGEGTTVINSLNIMTGEGAEYYDMTGCRTNGLKKGLNIVRQGGKTMKIIIK